MGVLDLKNLTANTSGEYAANMSNIALVTQRSIKTMMYERNGAGEWQALSLARMLDFVRLRYAPTLNQRLAELLPAYPDLTKDLLLYGEFILYIAFSAGDWRAIEFDSQNLVTAEINTGEGQATAASVGLATKIRDIGEFVISVLDLVENLAGSEEPANGIERFFKAKGGAASITTLVVGAVGLVGNLAVGIAGTICAKNEDASCQASLEIAEKFFTSVEVVAAVSNIVSAVGGLEAPVKGGFVTAFKEGLSTVGGKVGLGLAMDKAATT